MSVLFFFIQKGFDVFNALDLMENKTFLEKLKFGIGDGNLQYYLYNWKCPSMGSEKVPFYSGNISTLGYPQGLKYFNTFTFVSSNNVVRWY